MAISRISAASAQTTNVAITTPTAGDLILVFSHRDGSNTAPSLAAGYTSVDATGANTNSARLAYKYSDGTETTSGTWTNATSVAVAIYRGIDPHYPIGAWAVAGGASVTLSFTGITLWAVDNTSWVVGFAGHRTATNVNVAPTGMTLASGVADCAVSDTNATTTSWSTQTVTVNANSGWRTYTVELRSKPAINSAPATDLLVQHVCGSNTGGGNVISTITGIFPNDVRAGNCLIISVTHAGVYTATITDTQGNTWSSAIVTNDTLNSYKISQFVAANSIAGKTSVTVTIVTEASFGCVNMVMAEFHGIATASPVDVSSGQLANNTSAPIQPGSLTTTQADDLIYHVTFSEAQYLIGTAFTEPKRMAAGPGMTLLASDLLDGTCVTYGIRSPTGAFNPSQYIATTGVANSDTYITAAIALKTSAGAGTPPPANGKRIISMQNCNFMRASSATVNLQFPCTGNLGVFTWLGFDTILGNGIDLSSVSDGASNQWVATGAAATTPQGAGLSRIYYSEQPTTYPNRIGPTLTLDANQQESNGMLYDLAGFGASPFEQDVKLTDTQLVPGDLTTVTISVLNTDGIIISCGGIDLHTISGLVGAAFYFDDMVYPAADGARNFYEDNPLGHYWNSAAESVTFIWSTQNNPDGVNDWCVRAAAFRVPQQPVVLPQIAPNLNWKVLYTKIDK